ncbi:Nodulation protein D 2 [Serratia quinivorans]|uniref:LysR family transcriptional regulator n=1 Tax=Serratia quinivorans TaxID=137545 RepID=UPI00217B3370|nr:LysR family transcriptional regulator [Serratia quinivorans]CAI1957892.1 Nodulation protein D 2 [Serratia quinivorans]CAI2018060.1 Nodulation protein D 2 [Serratia quinivorans]CAI2156781.1 Nodulation protein D 2 [Serratia quinivorans]CAI2158621.1 Nodulation protein D 2 [Serratia quinivorans]CAI2398364.1 Nodulation protein D 2 [Serratia quinivorans]
MHMKGLDLNLLIVFDVLLCEKNVTCAAQKLGLSQSAVSHALARLRTFFADPLFIKGAVGMEPTPRALQLRAPIGRILLEVRQHIQSPTPFEPALARRQFTLALTDLGEVVMLPTLLRQFRQLAPRCTLRSVQIPPEQMEQALAGGELDLAVGPFPHRRKCCFSNGFMITPLWCWAVATIANYTRASRASSLSACLMWRSNILAGWGPAMTRCWNSWRYGAIYA